MIIQFCGLSGSGKTTLAQKVKKKLNIVGANVEIIDGDVYRKTLCKDLGFSKSDRIENIRRLGCLANTLSSHGIISIISAINPYEEARADLKATYDNVKTVYLKCPLKTLIARDTKGLYKRANLPSEDPQKILNLTGINDAFDTPAHPDLYLNTAIQDVEESANKLFHFIICNVDSSQIHFKNIRSNAFSF